MHHNLTQKSWLGLLLHWSFPFPEVKLQQLSALQGAELPPAHSSGHPALGMWTDELHEAALARGELGFVSQDWL